MSSADALAAPPAVAVAAVEVPALDDRDAEPRTPMKRLGSTRKLAAFNNIRLQLAEQARVLEARAEAAAGVAGELHDYCRRRADLEHEYSRALDKLARAAAQRHRDQRHKRGEWQLVGAYSCWQTALEQTRALARDHAALADLYGGRLAARTQRAADDVARLHRKCKDIVVERHEEVGGALVEAGAAGKARAAAAAEWRAAAAKLRHAYEQRERVAAAEPTRHKKLKALDKELEKRRQRHSEARARALRARADYILCLEAANATLQRYYLDDVADIMLCMETGFSAVVGRCVQAAGAADEARAAALSAAARALCACARALDAPADRQRVLDAHPQTFAPPPAQLYQGTPPDEEDVAAAAALGGAGDDEAAAAVGGELAARLQQLEAGARALRAECRERAKTLDAAERELVLQMEGSDEQWDVSGMFGACSLGGASAGGGDEPLLSPAPPPTPATPSDAPRKEQEDYYLAKFRSYVCAMGRLARMESRAATLRARLVPALAPARLPPPAPATPTPDDAAHSYRCVRGQWSGGGGGGGWGVGVRGQFAAPLEEQPAGSRRPLPRVLTECVRVIATYGLRHQGIFRVSGSQVEMQALRAAFERGGDPLCAVRDASDINSVCGLLKLYLRELRPPLLPPALLDRLLQLASLRDESEFVPRMRDLVATLPLCSMLVLRYLFAFLHHLSQYSEDNMMDAWNLAICLGPTLLAARGEGGVGGGGQVHAQNQVNELVKRVIVHHRDIFPQHVAPHAAYRPETFTTAADGEGVMQQEEAEHNGDVEVEGGGEGSCSGSEGGDGGRGDHMDDLSLYDDDEEASSDEDDSGSGSVGWGEHAAGGDDEPDRCVEDVERRAAQVVPVPGAPRAAAPAPAPPARRLAEATPDLVLDLPARAPGEPACAPAPAELATTAADTFLHNRDTLKKRPVHNKQTSSGSEEEGVSCVVGAGRGDEGAGEGSPVPARNTARVAAKFAELTLTGGSLKPALAAKPALLRRPTPHPHHATPPPAPHTPDH